MATWLPMGGSGGEDRGDGDDAVGGIEMQLVADPGFPEPLAVAFDTDITLGWQPGAHLVERLRALLIDAGQRFGWQDLHLCADAHACAWAAHAAAGHPTTGDTVSRGLRSPWHRARYDRRCDLADDGGRAAHAHVPTDLVRQIHAVVFDPCRNATDVVRAVDGLAEHGRANQAANAVRHRANEGGDGGQRGRLAFAPAALAAGSDAD